MENLFLHAQSRASVTPPATIQYSQKRKKKRGTLYRLHLCQPTIRTTSYCNSTPSTEEFLPTYFRLHPHKTPRPFFPDDTNSESIPRITCLHLCLSEWCDPSLNLKNSFPFGSLLLKKKGFHFSHGLNSLNRKLANTLPLAERCGKYIDQNLDCCIERLERQSTC